MFLKSKLHEAPDKKGHTFWIAEEELRGAIWSISAVFIVYLKRDLVYSFTLQV